MITVGLGMIVQPMVKIRDVVAEPRETDLVVILLTPLFGLRRDGERFLIPANVEEGGDKPISISVRHGWIRYFKAWNRAFIKGHGIVILLVRRKTSRQHQPGLRAQILVAAMPGNAF